MILLYATQSQYMSKSEFQELISSLKRRGCRLSGGREALLRALASAGKPLTAAAIMRSAAVKQADLDRATVYRALGFWEKEGLVEILRLEGDERLYHLNLHHHHHLICTACKKIASLEFCRSLRQEEAMIAKQTGFKIQRHTLEFYGLCPECAQKNN